MAKGKKTDAINQEVIELKEIKLKQMTVTIQGDGDLILNKMNNRNTRALVDARKDKAKDVMAEVNVWEDIISAMHWYKGEPDDYSEKGLKKALKENAPCITAFGLKKSFAEAVVRNEIDVYATKFNNGVNVIANGGLIPIIFTEHTVDEKLMSPKKGSPVLVRLNRFSGWSADITIQYTGTVYSAEQIVNIINLAGFGGGIGSGRTSGYGRYHVISVK